MDLTPPRCPDDYYSPMEGRHAAAVAAVELVGVLRSGGRLSGLHLPADDEHGFRLAVSVLIRLVMLDWRNGHASDPDYFLALRAERALEALSPGGEHGADGAEA